MSNVLSPDSNEKLSSKAKVQWILTIALPLLMVFCLPTGENYTEVINIFLADTLFIMMLVCFELVPIAVPAVVLPILYLITGCGDVGTCFGMWSSGTTMYMVTGALVLGAVMQENGLLQRIALIVINICGGTFTRTMYGLFLAGTAIGLLTYGTGWFIIATFVLGVAKALGCGEIRSKESTITMLVGMLATFGFSPFVYDPMKLAIQAVGMAAVGLDPDWWYFYLLGVPYFIFCMLWVFILTKIFKTKNFDSGDSAAIFRQQLQDMGKITRKETASLGCVALIFAFMLTYPLHGLSTNYGFMILPWFLFAPGINAGTKDSFKGVDLGVIFFLAGCMSIGNVATSIGIPGLVTNIFLPLLEGKSVLFGMMAIVFICMLANIVMTPAALAGAFSLPVCVIGATMNMHPETALMCMSFATDLYFFPHEVTAILVVYTYGLISMPDFIKYNTLKIVLFFVLFAPLFYGYYSLIGYVYA